MTPELYAWLEQLHGLLGVLGAALILHPVVTLRTAKRPSRWTQFTADLGAALWVAPFVIGWQIYPSYRHHIKPRLWVEQHQVALSFESKEHLAFLATTLAVAGALTLRAGSRERELVRLAHALFLTAWGCGAVTAILGVHVSSAAHLP